jgi:hypothetical protein
VTPDDGTRTAIFTIEGAPSDAELTAEVTDDPSGRYRLLTLTDYDIQLLPADSTGDIPRRGRGAAGAPAGGTIVNMDPAGQTDGTTPLTVSRGDTVIAAVQFTAVPVTDQDVFEANLVIRDVSARNPWAPIRPHLIAHVASIRVSVPDAATVARGHQATVPLEVVALTGPATTMSFGLFDGPPGIQLAPLQFSLEPRDDVRTRLVITAAVDAPLGAQSITISSSAYDGALTHSYDLTLTVLESTEEICQAAERISNAGALDDSVWSNFGIIDSGTTTLGYVFPPRLVQPTNLPELSAAVKHAEESKSTARALGSGWGFSDSVVPQSSPIPGIELFPLDTAITVAMSVLSQQEWPRVVPAEVRARFGHAIDTTGLDASLQHLLPSILADGQDLRKYFFVEAGIKLANLGILLDSQRPRVALRTLGGAAGQTLAGAISTGTHGGDIDRPPVADCIRAFYLVGAGGKHYWVERDRRVTDKAKLRAVFPCLTEDNVLYNDDVFEAVMVSMGAMGVIYAAIVDVVPQYSLLQYNRVSTWEQLRQDRPAGAGRDLAGVVSGDWTGLNRYLLDNSDRFGLPIPRTRFVQVVINPIRREDGQHTCYVSNRVELPLQARRGVRPVEATDIKPEQIKQAILSDQHAGDPVWDAADLGVLLGGSVAGAFLSVAAALHFLSRPHAADAFALAQLRGDLGGSAVVEQARNLYAFCKSENYPWALRDVLDLFMSNQFPEPGKPPDPTIDVGYLMMAGTGTARSAPTLGGTSVEVGFDFAHVDNPDEGLRRGSAIGFVDTILGIFDRDLASDAKLFPAGWLSLRACGRTAAWLGMQQFDLTGMVELALLGNVAARYGAQTVARWREIQKTLGGDTFRNLFMERCGL